MTTSKDSATTLKPSSETLYEAIMEISQSCLLVVDEKHQIRDVSRSFCKVFGFSEAEIISQPVDLILAQYDNSEEFIRDLNDNLDTGRADKGQDYTFQDKSGRIMRMRLTQCPAITHKSAPYLIFSITPLSSDQDGDNREAELNRFAEEILFTQQQYEEQASKMVQMAEELSIQKEKAEENRRIIEYQACHDALTNLGNRFLIKEKLPDLLDMADANKSVVGVIYIDIDNLKPVNDKFGHEAGDAVILNVAESIHEDVNEKDLAIRLGGDEFAIFTEMPREQCEAILENRAQKLLDTMSLPLYFSGEEVRVQASIGLAFYPLDGDDIDQILHAADEAMYEAKQSGKGMIIVKKDTDAPHPA